MTMKKHPPRRKPRQSEGQGSFLGLVAHICAASTAGKSTPLLKGSERRPIRAGERVVGIPSLDGMAVTLPSDVFDPLYDTPPPRAASPELLAMLRRAWERRPVLTLPAEAQPHLPVGWVWLPVLGWVVFAYLVINVGLPRVPWPAWLEFYVIQTFLWGALVPITWQAGRRSGVSVFALGRSVILTGLMMGAVQVAFFVLAGLMFGFGRSPYSRRLWMVIGNLVYALTALGGMEFGRAYLVTVLSRRNPTLAFILVMVIFSLTGISILRLGSINGTLGAIQFAGETVLPQLSENMLATYLALLGGPFASIAYLGVLELFEWLSPILPNPNWIITAMLGTLVPAIGLLVIQGLEEEEASSRREKDSDSGSIGWVIVGLFAVAMVWFNTGLLGVQPTLMSGPSMNPTLWAGDVVITRNVPAEKIEVGDIIRFIEGDKYVVHRVIAIEEGPDGYIFTTRGDNNNDNDPPVLEGQLRGKVILIIPKIGYVSIWARDLIDFLKGLIS